MLIRSHRTLAFKSLMYTGWFVLCIRYIHMYVCMCGYKADEKTITAAATAMTTTNKQ